MEIGPALRSELGYDPERWGCILIKKLFQRSFATGTMTFEVYSIGIILQGDLPLPNSLYLNEKPAFSAILMVTG
jgi:hypothetical protein